MALAVVHACAAAAAAWAAVAQARQPRAPSPGPAAEPVPLYGVYEQRFSVPGAGVGNPWRDATLAVTLERPAGGSVAISGFFHGRDEWRFRFAPTEKGRWRWTAALSRRGVPQPLRSWEGDFLAVPSEDRGFLRIGSGSPPRLVHDDGSLFPGIGFGTCVVDANKNGTPHDEYGFDGEFRTRDNPRRWSTDLRTYARAFGKHGAGFNLFRFSVDNCSFGLYQTIAPGRNAYLEREGLWADELIDVLRANGFRIYMAIFGFRPPYNEGATPEQMAAIGEYIDYVCARFAARVDIWELMNEAHAEDSWITQVAALLRKADPYDHPISTSWERPRHPAVEIVSPHWYEREDERVSDERTAQMVRDAQRAGKPVVFGEQGNAGANWDPRSAVRMRLRSWTALFTGGVLVFWNSSYGKDAKQNIYIGPEERGYVRVLQDFAKAVGPQSKPFRPEARARGSEVRAYGLSEPERVSIYLVHAGDRRREIEAEVQFDSSVSGTAAWIDTATGKTLAGGPVGAGRRRLKSPPFAVDIALAVSPASGQERAGGPR